MDGSETARDDRRTVFFSYSRADRPRAVPVIEALEASGLSVWWDGLLKGGERFAQSTETALETSDAVVVLWSAASTQSDWVRDEATRGRDRRRMVSVSHDGSEPPLGFRQVQYIDFTGWKGNRDSPAFAELLAAIEHVAEGAEPLRTREGPGSRPRAFSRRAALAAAAGTVVVGGGAALWLTGAFGAKAAINSIAVLPFENLSGDPDQAYFSGGLTEELRATLSLNPQLEVMAQTTSEKALEETGDPVAVAQRLGVANVLQGSVRRAADRVRIVATLVSGKDGFEKWSQTFDRPFGDIFAIQREIATEAVDALLVNLDKDLRQTTPIGGTDNPQALDEYMRGKALYDLARDESTDLGALAAFQKAIALDPRYAAAHAALARVNTFVGSNYVDGSRMRSYFDRALAEARKATALAPEMAEGHSALGFALVNGKLDLSAAREPYRRSYELGFGNAPVLTSFAIYAIQTGDKAGALDALARAERIDPLNALVFRTSALAHFAARDMDGARKAARTALSLNPKISTINRMLGDIAVTEGNWQRAADLYRKEPNALQRLRGMAIVEPELGNRGAGEQALADIVDEFGTNSLYQQAQVRAQWGDSARAMDALEAGFEKGDAGLSWMLTDPLLDPIRQDPRFGALLARLGLSPGETSDDSEGV